MSWQDRQQHKHVLIFAGLKELAKWRVHLQLPNADLDRHLPMRNGTHVDFILRIENGSARNAAKLRVVDRVPK